MLELNKKLLTRHVNMIAIGGSIGTGIFLASGYSIAIAGPGGALLANILMAIIVYFLITSLGEMSAYKPSSGSLCDYANLYVGKSFGFAMGYNYWVNWAITIAAEISASSLVMGYWFHNINPVYFSLVFFIAVFIVNLFSVRIYGEVEYILSFVKFAVIIVFLALGFFSLLQVPEFGIHKWFIGDAPFHQGYFGFISVFLFAGFAFQGSELIGIAAGEAKDPAHSIPQATKMVFWRLTLFYVLSILVISLLIPYNDHRLTNQDSVVMSPYTLVFSMYIGKYAATILNIVILITLISAANASMYSATRILWFLAKAQIAPKAFSKVTAKGLPVFALLASAFIGGLVFLSSIFANSVVFSYLLQISSLCGFIAWFGIALSHYKFRKNFLPQVGGVTVLKYQAKWYPWAQLLAMIAIIFIVIAQFITLEGTHNWFNVAMIYSSVILFAMLYLGHKIYNIYAN